MLEISTQNLPPTIILSMLKYFIKNSYYTVHEISLSFLWTLAYNIYSSWKILPKTLYLNPVHPSGFILDNNWGNQQVKVDCPRNASLCQIFVLLVTCSSISTHTHIISPSNCMPLFLISQLDYNSHEGSKMSCTLLYSQNRYRASYAIKQAI